MWRQIRYNEMNSFCIAAMMAFVLMVTGLAIGFVAAGAEGGAMGAFAAIGVWVIMLMVSYYSGDKILLFSSQARKIEHTDFPLLHNVVEEMKIASGFARMPDVYLIDDSVPNAFATGRGKKDASVAITTGLLERLNRDELQGVIAHEMSHIVNRDVLFMMIIGVMVGSVALLSDMFFRVMLRSGAGRRSSSSGGGAQIVILLVAVLFVLLSPFIAQFMYFAISRKREYLADACAAQLTRYPEGLAAALEKISTAPGELHSANRITAPMFIINPFKKAWKGLTYMGSTHPPTDERIRILRGMTGSFSLVSYQKAWQQTKGGGARSILFTDSDVTTSIFTGRPPARTEKPTAGQARLTAQPSARPSSQPVESRAAVNDFFWKQKNYGFIDCECGVRLKIPPNFTYKIVLCPSCHRKHELPSKT